MMSSMETMRKETLASQQYLIVFSALICWDFFSLLPTEYRHIYLAEWSFLKICYLLNRYGSLVLVVICTTLRLTPISPDTCGRLFWAQPFCLVYVVLITDAMLINRVVILYERDRKVLAGLSALFTVEAVTMIAAATQVGYLKLPPPVAAQLNLEGCLAQGYRGDTFPGNVIFLSLPPLVINSVLLLLTLYKSWRTKKELGVTLPLLRRINRVGLQYFAVIAASNVVNFYFYHQPNPCIRSFNMCANIVCSSLLSCRLALSLFDYRPATPTIPNIPPSPMPSTAPRHKVTFHDPRLRELGRSGRRIKAAKRNSAGIGSYSRAMIETIEEDAASDSDESARTVELIQ